MEMKWLGKTGVRVSALAFGTMSFGGDADPSESAELYAACRDAGINHFDTADMYSRGESERILGKLIAHERDAIVLASKAYFPMGDDPNMRGASRRYLVRAVEASLERLGTDRLDLFYLHRFDDLTDLADTLRGVEDLVRSGKVLYPAVSNFAAWQVQKALGLAALSHFSPVCAIQPMYNLVKRQAEVELFPMAESEGLAVFPYSPLAAGLLTGKYSRQNRPNTGRLVDNKMYMRRYEGQLRVAEGFTELAKELSMHPVTLAVAWAAAHPAVTSPLLGARHVGQLGPALLAADLKLDDATWQRVSELNPAPPPATDRTEERDADFLGSR